MNQREENFLSYLTEDRRNNLQVIRKPSMIGLWKSIVEKYSDEAHFVYELLQNADDVGATRAKFILDKNKLIFKHNGKKKFTISDPANEEVDTTNGTLGDINAITSIGNSNKTTINTIGKFGVGFKAVFRYCAVPAIFDGNFSFSIENFIVPKPLTAHKTDETIFEFPFSEKYPFGINGCPPAQAHKEISDKLKSLDCPLLFLSNLTEIEFSLGGTRGIYRKEIKSAWTFGDTTAELLTLIQTFGVEMTEQKLWLFSRQYSGKNYCVGFFLDEKNHLKAVDKPAFCFFPTKRVTGLKFIIHAPFLLTDSREGITTSEEHNQKMINLLAALAADSLIYLRDFCLIDDGILKIIPVNESDFDSNADLKFFKPFFTAIKDKMKTSAILPTGNSHVSSENAYWAETVRLTEVFSDRQLGELVKNPNAAWVFTTIGERNAGVVAPYIKSVTQGLIDEDDLFKYIDKKFIENQPINWFYTFYKWLSETSRRIEIAKKKPFFLDEHGKATAAFDVNKNPILFLPNDSNYRAINAALLDNSETAKFLKLKIEIKEPSLKDEIYNKILPRYENNSVTDDEVYFKKIFSYYRQCPIWEVESYIEDLKNKFLLRTLDGEFAALKNLYMPEEELIKYFSAVALALKNPSRSLQKYFPQDGTRQFLDKDFYLSLIGEKNRDLLLNFFKQLGIADEVRYLSQEFDEIQAESLELHVPISEYEITWRENVIDGCIAIFEDIVDNENAEHSLILWQRLIAVNENVGRLKDKLIGQRFAGKKGSYTPVNLSYLLYSAWLVDKSGNFKTPAEITLDEMAYGYDTESDSAREIIEFFNISDKKFADNNLTEEQRRLIDKAKKLEEVGATEEEFQEFIAQKRAQKHTAEKTSVPKKLAAKKIHIVDENSENAVIAPISAPDSNEIFDDTPDADDFTPATVDYDKKLEIAKAKSDAEQEKIAQLEELQKRALNAATYSFGWCKTLLELEILNSNANINSKEISISFGRVEFEAGTQRTLILKYPSQYIPQFMEDLENIPLVLRTAEAETKVEIEVVGVRHNTLSAKIKDSSKLDDVNLSEVTEARINVKDPVFLLEELKSQFDELGFNDDFDLRENLQANIEFVFGPPGTGKTTHLADEILALMNDLDNKKILVLTPTNKAADVLASKIIARAKNKNYLDWLLRFGTTNDAEIEKSNVFHDKIFDINSKPKNVTITTIARFPYDFFMPKGKRIFLRGINWDYIIIDEASMIMLAQILLPLYKKTPKKFILAGDPFQIEPVTAIDLWKGENIYTMVGLNDFAAPKTFPHDYLVTKLTTQYRSVPAVGEIFSRLAYKGILKHARADYSKRPLNIDDWLEVQTLNIVKFPVSRYESVYRARRLNGTSSYQIYSALFTFEFVKALDERIKKNNPDEKFSIGIISPYRAQAVLIEKLFAATKCNVQIGTIHTFQGDECDILLAVFNPPPIISASPEMFLNHLNIVNVAISRARDYLFVIMPDDNTEKINNLWLIKKVENLFASEGYGEFSAHDIEKLIFGAADYIEENSFATGHQNVNVYAHPERKYEIRSEDNTVDVWLHEKKFF